MTTMTHHTVTDTSWTEVASATVRCFVQLKSGEAVLVHVGASTPAAGSHVGIVLETGEAMELSLDQLEAGDRVFVRSFDGPATVLVAAAAEAPV